MDDKDRLRKSYKKKREELGEELRQIYSRQICRRLSGYFHSGRYDMVFVYYPLGCEVSLLPFIKELWEKKVRTAFPKVVGKELFFFEVSEPAQLKEGFFHIMEPIPEYTKQVYPAAGTDANTDTELPKLRQNAHADVLAAGPGRILVLTPGLIFDRRGNRMGYGRGFYDRFLADMPEAKKTGIAFECQLASQLEAESWDIKMDVIITEKQIYCITEK